MATVKKFFISREKHKATQKGPSVYSVYSVVGILALVALFGAGNTFAQSTNIDARLEASLQELAKVREAIAKEKLPMVKGLNSLEDELTEVRQENQQVQRQLDSRNLDLNNLRSEIKSRQGEKSYISNLLGEYIRNFQTRLHIAELNRYNDQLQATLLAPDNSNLSDEQIFIQQTALVETSIKRLQEVVGGATFDGSAAGEDGLVKQGKYVMVGPVALFSSQDGSLSGVAEVQLGSLEPKVMPFSDPTDADKVRQVVADNKGVFPFDPTLGDARKMEETKEPFIAFSGDKGSLFGFIEKDSTVGKGGYVGLVIIVMFLIALVITVIKWIQLSRIPMSSEQEMKPVLDAMLVKDYDKAAAAIKKIKGPTGAMLTAGIEHIEEPKDLVEEVMYEEMLTTRLKVNKLTPFLAVCASSSPLMGLLGTVTGIINTFKVITVKGAGDVKSLSGGISEALITTEFGLVVAISALVLYAFLSRKGKSITDSMEQMAILFINRATRSAPVQDDSGEEEVLGTIAPVPAN